MIVGPSDGMAVSSGIGHVTKCASQTPYPGSNSPAVDSAVIWSACICFVVQLRILHSLSSLLCVRVRV